METNDEERIPTRVMTHSLREDQIVRLERLARLRRASRSQIVREAVEEYLIRQEARVA